MRVNLNSAIKIFERKQVEGITPLNHIKVGQRIEIISRILRNRTQYFRGIVIAKYNKGIMSSFNVRKVISGNAIEQKFLLYDRRIIQVNPIDEGRIRQSKLYYLRDRFGASFRLKPLRFKARQSNKSDTGNN